MTHPEIRDPAFEALTPPELKDGWRVGIGFDVHRLTPERPLRLGGLEFPGERGLAGHSDGDAVLHALIDALLGAAHLGDIGKLFPPTNDRWRGADSAELLRLTVRHVRDAGWTMANADVVIAASQPAIDPVRRRMENRIADLLGVAADDASVKGTTTDGLGLVASDGIAAYAICLLRSRS